ncbi:DUF2975 domain-containing protein [Romboutsia maritimum]|uniref:DUF2975 domain-containing protein n=1 Tax=Romboutsia maritimum TaxID=2020948 RepID=A0A371IRT4_9FIRM|nr:DUF2975 domain-containing protein [Romboutsia maritimum]RDY23200.1 DUF2975 domain-containing protein [Romboutsia maritimum]
MKKDFSSKILNNIVLVGIVLTVLALLITPLGITAIFKSQLGITESNIPIVISIGIYICAIPYVVSLILLKKICKFIAIKEPFSMNIPIYLKKISICAFSEILIFNAVQIGLYYFFDIYLYAISIIPAIIVSFVCLAIGFLSIVLGKLFEMAIEIKDENDKTI